MQIDKTKDEFIDILNKSIYSEEHNQELKQYLQERYNKEIINSI